MAVIHITKENYEEKVIKADKLVLLDFWAGWCGPCKMLAPVIDEIAEECQDVVVGKVNIDEEPQLAGDFNVMSIPTLVVMEGGKAVKTVVGVHSKNDILDMLGKGR